MFILFLPSAATPAAAQTFLGCLEADGQDGSSFNLVTTNPVQAGDAVVYFAGARQGNQDDNTTTIADLEDDFAFPSASIDEIRVHGGIDTGGALFAPQVYYIDFDAAAIPSGTSVPITENGAGSADFGVCAVAISNVDQVAVADVTSDTGTSMSTTISTAPVSIQSGDVLLAGFAEINQYQVVSSSGSGAASGLTLYTPLNAPNNINTLAGGTASTSGSASYEITYGTAGFSSASILAFRGSPNSDPVFASGASTSLSVDEDDAATSLSALLEAGDPDTGQTLTWSVASAPANGTLAGFPATATSGTGVQPSGVTYEPNTDFAGSDSFEIQVDDGNGGTDNITVSVTVNNLAPVFTSAATASFAENATGPALDNDATNGGDGTADSGVTYSLSGTDASAFTIDAGTGALSFASAPDFESPTDSDGNNEYVVDVTADDGEASNNTAVQSLTITVTDVTETPVATTSAASAVTSTEATLNGTVGTGGGPDATITFEYYVSAEGAGTATTVAATPSTTDGESGVTVTADLTGLIPNTEYTFEVISTTDEGTTRGGTQAFTTVVVDLQVTDGSAAGLDVTASASGGTANNVVGVFSLSASSAGATVDAVSITNDNPGVPDISAARLFASPDQTLDVGSDTRLEELAVDNTNAPASFDFSGFSESLSTSETYFILAIDIDADAVASDVRFFLGAPSDLTLTGAQVVSVNGQSQTTFTDLPLSNASATLPVEMAGFEATPSNGQVELRWATLTETNNSGFNVQRRIGKSQGWTSLARIAGAGNSSDRQSYRFTDDALPYEASAVEYRLQQVDVDGTESFTEPVAVEMADVDRIELLGTSPNPTRTRATVRFAVPDDAEDARLVLFDLLGRQVRSLAVTGSGRQKTTLDTDGLATGTYFLRLTAGGQVRTTKLTVVR